MDRGSGKIRRFDFRAALLRTSKSRSVMATDRLVASTASLSQVDLGLGSALFVSTSLGDLI